jgi:hypothetical protein
MGLLDEAIREHLELKRQRGADPSEIARAEHEALEPIFPPEGGAEEHANPAEPPAEVEPSVEVAAAEDPGVAGQTAIPGAAADDGQDFSTVGQETVELDMQAFLDADPDKRSSAQPQDTSAAPVRASGSGPLPEPDSLEWDVPGGSQRQAPPEQVPGQERLSFE